MIDYKKIIKSREFRQKILEFLRFIPDKFMLPIQYRIKTGRKLNLKNPQRYTEKIQWYKLNYRNPIMQRCVDKYKVREYVKDKGLSDILIRLYKRYHSVEEIEWVELPNKFVMKTTNGGGGLNVVICDDKAELDIEDVKRILRGETIMPGTGGREWAYYGLKPGIIVEEMLINEDNPKAGVNDYKLFCYGGKVKYIIVDVDRYIEHKRNFYDRDWKNLHVSSDCPPCDREIEKPQNYDKMIRIAERLSEDFPYVRVDLYNQSGKIYFGELTFYPWSGYVQYVPDQADFLFGEGFKLEKYKN